MSRPVAIGPRPLWSVLVGATGGLTWTQTAFGAGAEILAGTPRHGHAALCMLAGAVLIAGLARRNAAVLLLAFPLALLACFATMAPDALAATFGPFRWLPWCLSTTAYLLVTSLWLSEPGAESMDVEREPLATKAAGRPVAPSTLARIVIGCLLLAVPAAALVLQYPAKHLTAEPEPALLFAHFVLVFSWCVGVYSYFIAPMLDMERNRRTTTRALADENYLRRSRVQLGGLGLAAVVLFLLWARSLSI